MAAPSFSSFPDLEYTSTAAISEDPRPRKRREKELWKKRALHHDDNEPGTSASHQHQPVDIVLEDERSKAIQDQQLGYWDQGSGRTHKSTPLYFSDRKGDVLNITYGGIHKGDLSKYRLLASGRKILGLDNAWSVVHRGPKGIEVALNGLRKTPRLTDSSSRALLNSGQTRRLVTSSNSHKYDEVDGFIRIPSRHGRQDEQSYRAITNLDATPNSDSDSSPSEALGSDDSGDDSDTTPLTSLQVTLKALEQKLTADPTSLVTWCSLLSHSLSTIPANSKNASKARSEIALSILSRALSADARNRSSEQLRLKYLHAGEEVWDEARLRVEWEIALKVVPGVEIWVEWLVWKIRKAKSVDKFVDDGKRVFAALGGGEENEIGKLRVLWLVAVAFQEAGFGERAMALFQAQAELIFNVPHSLRSSPLGIRLDALEVFWESEVPRIGEHGAIGWATWEAKGRPEHVPTTPASAHISLTHIQDPFRKWAEEELQADGSSQWATRSTDENELSDPYATILFSDIRPLLVLIDSLPAKQAFRLVWLSFIGLHHPGFTASLSSTESCDDKWSVTRYATSPFLSSVFPSEVAARRQLADSYAGALVGREREHTSGFGPVKSWGFGVLGPLDCVGDEAIRMWSRPDIAGIDEQSVRRIFEQCRLGPDDLQWDTLALAFEAAVSLKSATKLSRSFLAAARDSIPHWAVHARLECLRDRKNHAIKIYETVVSASSFSTSHLGAGQLLWDWTRMEWLLRKSDAAIIVILRAAGAEASSSEGVGLLRAKRGLDDALKNTSISNWKEREAWIKMRALLELLTQSPASALAIFDTHLNRDAYKAGTTPHESLTIALLDLLYVHGTVLRNPFPPSVLRQRVQKALDVYPSNTIVLGIFLEGEKGEGVWGRVRALLGENTVTHIDGVAREKDVARRIADVWMAGWEKGRWESERERTRSGLAAAVQNDRTRASAVMWRMYLEFEIRGGQLQRGKSLLFRAIRECPTVKELYLLACGPLRSVFTSRELTGLAETMAERGLRMRKGLDEVVDGWKDVADNGHKSSEASGDEEIEHNAQELRRLMPY